MVDQEEINEQKLLGWVCQEIRDNGFRVARTTWKDGNCTIETHGLLGMGFPTEEEAWKDHLNRVRRQKYIASIEKTHGIPVK